LVKEFAGVWLPDREDYLIGDIRASKRFAGLGTIQFQKFQRAFGEFREFRHAVDIGANLGIWTRVMARCFPLVTCFEPNSECHEAFWLNNPRDRDPQSKIILHRVALGKKHGRVKLNTKLRSTGFTRVDPNGDFEVEMATLDSYALHEVDFIKIDVEGFEAHVVSGAIETIRTWRPVMIVEQKPNNAELHGLTQHQATRFLTKMGAKVFDTVSGDVILTW
jgi:FkbM family methyltransferase